MSSAPSRKEIVMPRLLLIVCLVLAVLLVSTGPAAACINDRDTPQTEVQFKKQYEFRSGYEGQQTDAERPYTEGRWVPVAAAGTGLGLLAATVGLIRFNVRRFRGE
jgi:hypothetical protein